MGVATHLSPADFLRALARRLRTTPEHVPASRATEELLSWIEACTAAGERPEPVFLRTAVRLVYDMALLERAQELLDSTALELADIWAFVEALRTDPYGRPPRLPPSRSNSANPSQELYKSRSNSAK